MAPNLFCRKAFFIGYSRGSRIAARKVAVGYSHNGDKGERYLRRLETAHFHLCKERLTPRTFDMKNAADFRVIQI